MARTQARNTQARNIRANRGGRKNLATTRIMQRSQKRIDGAIDRYAGSAGKQAKTQVRSLTRKAERQEAKLRQQARKQMAHAQKNFSKAQKAVREYIDHNPKKAAAIAAGVGAAIGAATVVAMRRRNR